MKDSIFVKCDCGSCSTLEVQYDEELGQFQVVTWILEGNNRPLSKKERSRWCREIKKTGNPWTDHTIVNKRDAQRIIDYLTRYINHGKKETK